MTAAAVPQGGTQTVMPQQVSGMHRQPAGQSALETHDGRAAHEASLKQNGLPSMSRSHTQIPIGGPGSVQKTSGPPQLQLTAGHADSPPPTGEADVIIGAAQTIAPPAPIFFRRLRRDSIRD